MNSPPSVTVLMCVFNGERWLSEAIDSVLRQTFNDFELLVINDGSTDSSADLIRHYARIDKRVIFHSKPNSGLADSLNIGIGLARGRWIARMDADDVSEPERLHEQVTYVQARPHIGLLGTCWIEIDELGTPVRRWACPHKHKQLVARLVNRRGGFFPHASAIFRTELVRSTGGYRSRILRAQDTDLWLRLAERSQLACITSPLVRIRKHCAQISHEEAGARQGGDSMLALVSYLLRQMGQPDPVDDLFDDQGFYQYRDFVITRLKGAGFFAQREFVHRLKKDLSNGDDSAARACRTIKTVAREWRSIPRHLMNRLFAEKVAFAIASEWRNSLRPLR
jgi:glycosyltransferase involved in cell wall biosynthesis